MGNAKNEIQKELLEVKHDYKEGGGWSSFESGQWFWQTIQRSFANYWKNANTEYFESKYRTKDKEKIAKKLIAVTAKNAAILGGITGVVISTDDFETDSTDGVALPANLAIKATGIGVEAILLMRFHLQMIANLGKLYGVPLDLDDPEDILTIFAFALGGSAGEMAGKFGMKVGGKFAGQGAKAIFKKETLKALKNIAAKVGVNILQRSIDKYSNAFASIGIGTIWNYNFTIMVAKIATKHFIKRSKEFGSDKDAK